MGNTMWFKNFVKRLQKGGNIRHVGAYERMILELVFWNSLWMCELDCVSSGSCKILGIFDEGDYILVTAFVGACREVT
jgi:hypothetical protein